MYKLSEKIVKWFNRQNLVLLLFIIGTANYIGWELYGGEEQYLGFAKQFMDHEWMPHSFTLNHPAGGNLVFQVVTGFFLRYFSFEQVAFWGRLINFFLLAIPLALIFRYLRFTNIETVIIFQLFYLPHQSIWAGEWVYKHIEEKSIAYIFIFFALYYLFKNKPLKSTLFTAAATFFHFLVGGWFFIISLIFYAVNKKSFKELLIYSGLYILILLPFIIYLGKVYLVNNESVISGIHTGWIYAYYRLPNHIGIFRDLAYFKNQHLEGVLTAFALFLLCIFYFRKFKRHDIQVLNTLNIIIFIQQFIFIIVAWFDKNGILLKTYPFRTSALTAFFMWLEIGLIFKYYGSWSIFNALSARLRIFKNKKFLERKLLYASRMNLFLLVIFFAYFLFECSETISTGNREDPPPDEAMQKVINFAKTETVSKSVFLIFDDKWHPSFIRRSNREKFVVYKFVPTESKIIYEWYDRLMWKEKLQTDISLIDSVRKQYRIDYLVSKENYAISSLQEIREFGDYKIYEVIDGWEK
jgi:hypothetical protein